jgi:hypothetical protein
MCPGPRFPAMRCNGVPYELQALSLVNQARPAPAPATRGVQPQWPRGSDRRAVAFPFDGESLSAAPERTAILNFLAAAATLCTQTRRLSAAPPLSRPSPTTSAPVGASLAKETRRLA